MRRQDCLPSTRSSVAGLPRRHRTTTQFSAAQWLVLFCLLPRLSRPFALLELLRVHRWLLFGGRYQKTCGSIIQVPRPTRLCSRWIPTFVGHTPLRLDWEVATVEAWPPLPLALVPDKARDIRGSETWVWRGFLRPRPRPELV